MANFKLQLLHFADQEAGIPALDDAPRLSAVLNALKNQDGSDAGTAPDFPNTLILSSGLTSLVLSSMPANSPLVDRDGQIF